MAGRVLLLDFDSVVLVNQHLKQYQLKRSAKFLKHHTQLRFEQCEYINKKLYPMFGHTTIMMNKMFDKKVTLEEYDDFVFSPKQLKTLNSAFDPDSRAYTNRFNNVYAHCEKTGIDCYIFTNAHKNWVTHFSRLSGLDIDENKIFWPTTTDTLKPKKLAYDTVENKFDKKQHYLFVDDSEVNLAVPRTLPNWTTFLFEGHHDASTVIETMKTTF